MTVKHLLASSEPHQLEDVIEWRLIIGKFDNCPILQARNVGAEDWTHVLTINELGELDPTFNPCDTVKGLDIMDCGWIRPVARYPNPGGSDE